MKRQRREIKRGEPPRRRKYLPRGKPPRARKADPKKRRWAKHRDADYEKWIKARVCLVCGSWPVDPAHITKRSTGGDDRNNLLPLCRTHHNEQEDHDEEFEARYHMNLRNTAIRLTALYESAGFPAYEAGAPPKEET